MGKQTDIFSTGIRPIAKRIVTFQVGDKVSYLGRPHLVIEVDKHYGKAKIRDGVISRWIKFSEIRLIEKHKGNYNG